MQKEGHNICGVLKDIKTLLDEQVEGNMHQHEKSPLQIQSPD